MPDANPPPKRTPARIGPPPDPGSSCRCGRVAAAKCDGCGENFCESHWNGHSHTSPMWRMGVDGQWVQMPPVPLPGAETEGR